MHLLLFLRPFIHLLYKYSLFSIDIYVFEDYNNIKYNLGYSLNKTMNRKLRKKET